MIEEDSGGEEAVASVEDLEELQEVEVVLEVVEEEVVFESVNITMKIIFYKF